MASIMANHKKCNHWITELFFIKSQYLKWNVKLDGCGQQVRFFQCKLSWVEIQPPPNETLFFLSRKRCSYWLRWMENKHKPALCVGIWASYLVEKKTRRNLVTNHCEPPINSETKHLAWLDGSKKWPSQSHTASLYIAVLWDAHSWNSTSSANSMHFPRQHESPS